MPSPLQHAIHAAVGEFSDTVQSLLMAKAVTLRGMIEKHIAPLLEQAEEDAAALSDIDDRLPDEGDDTAAIAVGRLVRERDEAVRVAKNAEYDIGKLKEERDGWKSRAEAFLDFDRLKGVLHGEFTHYVSDGLDDDGNERGHEECIEWTTVKDILKRAALAGECNDAPKSVDAVKQEEAREALYRTINPGGPYPRNATALEPAASKVKP